jgi:L-asparaginase
MIQLFTTGGTIDKIYFDAKSEFEIGDSLLPELLSEANINEPFESRALMRKDSLDMTDEDRQVVREAVSQCPASQILITHGTDSMADTAAALADLTGKTVVLMGSMQPARMRRSDAVFNLGFAWAALKLLTPGVYIAMNGEVFPAGNVRKNLEAGRFERL